MKYSTYLLLIGSVAASCTNDDIDGAQKIEKAAASDLEEKNWDGRNILYTSDYVTFVKALKEAQEHVDDMTTNEKIAKIGKIAEEITKADTDLKGAKKLLDDLIAKEGNAAFNKLMGEIEDLSSKERDAKKSLAMAIGKCETETQQDWFEEKLYDFKNMQNFDNLTDDNKEKLVLDVHEAMIKKLLERAAEVKVEAGYQDMTDEEKLFFDKIIVAQWETMWDKNLKMEEFVTCQGKSDEDCFKIDFAERMKTKERMIGMKEMFEGKREDMDKKDMEMRNQAGYMDMGDVIDQAIFDKELSERRKRVESNQRDMITKFGEAMGKMGEMTQEEKKKYIKEKTEDMKMKGSRDQEFEDHDFKQKMKMGFFKDMTQKEMDNFKNMEKNERDERKKGFEAFDKKMGEVKTSAKFSEMGDEDKKKFMGSAMMSMGQNMKQMMMDREDDDDKRKELGYFKSDSKDRENITTQIQREQGKRTEERMPKVESESGSKCFPAGFFKEGEYQGSRSGYIVSEKNAKPEGEDMMGKMMKEEMSKMMEGKDMGDMMKQGLKGLDGMMEKMGGMDGMMKKMQDITKGGDQDMEMMKKLQGMKGGMRDGIEGAINSGVKEGTDIVKEGMNMIKDGVKDAMGMKDKEEDAMGMKDKEEDAMGMKDKEGPSGQSGKGKEMQKGSDGMEQGMKEMMKNKFEGMMNEGKMGGMGEGKEDMMSMMGGKDGMQSMMGMHKGQDKEGNDMQKKFEDKMNMAKGQKSGPPSKEDFDKKSMEMKDKARGFNGGCEESLCCGHILEFGVWKDEYKCMDATATMNDDGYRFKCVEGAKNIAAGALAIAATLFMMQ